jgi:hypothetical protein
LFVKRQGQYPGCRGHIAASGRAHEVIGANAVAFRLPQAPNGKRRGQAPWLASLVPTLRHGDTIFAPGQDEIGCSERSRQKQMEHRHRHTFVVCCRDYPRSEADYGERKNQGGGVKDPANAEHHKSYPASIGEISKIASSKARNLLWAASSRIKEFRGSGRMSLR